MNEHRNTEVEPKKSELEVEQNAIKIKDWRIRILNSILVMRESIEHHIELERIPGFELRTLFRVLYKCSNAVLVVTIVVLLRATGY